MILFDLRCSKGHEFEAWFRDSGSYERLRAAGEVRCAICGDDKVEKALMAPNVRTRKAIEPAHEAPRSDDGEGTASGGASLPSPAPEPPMATTALEAAPDSSAFPEKVVEAMKMLREAQTVIKKNFDHVGRDFAEEARKIHYGEAEKRNIYGEATNEEAEKLADEGIDRQPDPLAARPRQLAHVLGKSNHPTVSVSLG